MLERIGGGGLSTWSCIVMSVIVNCGELKEKLLLFRDLRVLGVVV
jgi:hypothetical protein